MTHKVFVYGMLLREDGNGARLFDYQLEFYGHATPVPGYEDAVIYGAVVEVDDERLRGFDGIEGCNPYDPGSTDGYYRREEIEVFSDFGAQTAWMYVMNEQYQEPQMPSDYYVEWMRAGYVKHGLPQGELDAAVNRARDRELVTSDTEIGP